MPEISRFYGIVITMYWDEHAPPHFHAEYSGQEAVFDIIEGIFIRGALPSKQARLVLAWYELHKDELMGNWESIISGKGYQKIAPLV
jgi:hypothetical protein